MTLHILVLTNIAWLFTHNIHRRIWSLSALEAATSMNCSCQQHKCFLFDAFWASAVQKNASMTAICTTAGMSISTTQGSSQMYQVSTSEHTT
jgi:hypothetical protein